MRLREHRCRVLVLASVFFLRCLGQQNITSIFCRKSFRRRGSRRWNPTWFNRWFTATPSPPSLRPRKTPGQLLSPAALPQFCELSWVECMGVNISGYCALCSFETHHTTLHLSMVSSDPPTSFREGAFSGEDPPSHPSFSSSSSLPFRQFMALGSAGAGNMSRKQSRKAKAKAQPEGRPGPTPSQPAPSPNIEPLRPPLGWQNSGETLHVSAGGGVRVLTCL